MGKKRSVPIEMKCKSCGDITKGYIEVIITNNDKQKSKKTKKMIKFDSCKMKALYATHKYGCLGFIGFNECLECEFRR